MMHYALRNFSNIDIKASLLIYDNKRYNQLMFGKILAKTKIAPFSFFKCFVLAQDKKDVQIGHEIVCQFKKLYLLGGNYFDNYNYYWSFQVSSIRTEKNYL